MTILLFLGAIGFTLGIVAVSLVEKRRKKERESVPSIDSTMEQIYGRIRELIRENPESIQSLSYLEAFLRHTVYVNEEYKKCSDPERKQSLRKDLDAQIDGIKDLSSRLKASNMFGNLLQPSERHPAEVQKEAATLFPEVVKNSKYKLFEKIPDEKSLVIGISTYSTYDLALLDDLQIYFESWPLPVYVFDVNHDTSDSFARGFKTTPLSCVLENESGFTNVTYGVEPCKALFKELGFVPKKEVLAAMIDQG